MISNTTVRSLRRMIDLLLMAGGSDKKCDDLLEIKLVLSGCAERDYKPWEGLSEGETSDRYLLYPEIEITPKSDTVPQILIEYLREAAVYGFSKIIEEDLI